MRRLPLAGLLLALLLAWLVGYPLLMTLVDALRGPEGWTAANVESADAEMSVSALPVSRRSSPPARASSARGGRLRMPGAAQAMHGSRISIAMVAQISPPLMPALFT